MSRHLFLRYGNDSPENGPDVNQLLEGESAAEQIHSPVVAVSGPYWPYNPLTEVSGRMWLQHLSVRT